MLVSLFYQKAKRETFLGKTYSQVPDSNPDNLYVIRKSSLSRMTSKFLLGRNSGPRYKSLKVENGKRGVSSFLWVKNSDMQLIVHSKELIQLSRMIPKSTRFDDSRQSYDQKLIMVRTHFWVIFLGTTLLLLGRRTMFIP